MVRGNKDTRVVAHLYLSQVMEIEWRFCTLSVSKAAPSLMAEQQAAAPAEVLPNLRPPGELDVDAPDKRERWLDWKAAYER